MTASRATRWPLLRLLVTSHLPFVVLLWLAFTVVVTLIVAVIAIVGDVSSSFLHHAATQVPRWLLFGLGIDAISTYLRLHLAHGRTRREFTGQAFTYAVIVSGCAALLLTLSYLLERGYYAIFGWPQKLTRESVFTEADQYPAILGSYWLSLLLWTAAGLVIGLGFFRSTGLGLTMIPIGIVLVLPAILMVGNGGLPIFGEELAGINLGPGLVLGVAAGLFVVSFGISWSLVRDIPMKTQAS